MNLFICNNNSNMLGDMCLRCIRGIIVMGIINYFLIKFEVYICMIYM